MDPRKEIVKSFYSDKQQVKVLLNLAHINSVLMNHDLAFKLSK